MPDEAGETQPAQPEPLVETATREVRKKVEGVVDEQGFAHTDPREIHDLKER